MKGGVTKRIEDVLTALDQKQLKKALYLSEARGLERHHEWLEAAAKTCLANREDKKVCEQAITEARNKINATVTLPIDDTSLEGLEEYLSPQPAPQPTAQVAPAQGEMTDEELYEECEDCHVAAAAARFADICAEKPEEAGSCELIGRSLENENTEPVDWLKAMVQTAEVAQGQAKQEMVAALSELDDYLKRRNSPFLKALEKEGPDG